MRGRFNDPLAVGHLPDDNFLILSNYYVSHDL